MGKIIELYGGKIKDVSGLRPNSEQVDVQVEKDSVTKTISFYHEQECCEDVRLEEYHGSIDVGSILLEVTGVTETFEDYDNDITGTYTFYKIDTSTSSCTLRFLGESNGYYSEAVDIKVY